ncbi:hypothetical protein MNEG_14985 [Monoraphidium neglectum]|uniref:Uncharacterized protein n=1 Tax=Monoraphidium neglectum TaxID=145388 RepID=A0A0D2LMD7_9CHLO|nr:hypothetical protein MNEG_14985 [Monoraphidium neglectum]KIY92979.1 hypothetical protein MNEG_14985 [Monoraphidium neglectum]|eukprot:XP_013891999.1 hypothetical protein MNEG_14985 [Monoraphidium neglectum]
MLSALLTARTAAQGAGTLYELAGAEWWEARGEAPPPLPPEGVLQGVMRDLFSPAARGRLSSFGGAAGSGAAVGAAAQAADGAEHPQPAQQAALPRAACRGSLLGRLALHCLTFGNARAIALLWQRFVDEPPSHRRPGPLAAATAAAVAAAAGGRRGWAGRRRPTTGRA